MNDSQDWIAAQLYIYIYIYKFEFLYIYIQIQTFSVRIARRIFGLSTQS